MLILVGFAVIFALTQGVTLSKHKAVCGYHNLKVGVFSEKKGVCSDISL